MVRKKEMAMKTKQLVFSLYIYFSLLFFFNPFESHEMVMAQQRNTSSSSGSSKLVEEFKVGVVLNMDELIAKMGMTSMKMALSDFYSSSVATSYKRRLAFHTRSCKGDIVDAASAAIDLIKNVEVQAIIGAVTSAQADFMVDLGNKSQVPIISFTATSPFVSPSQNPYFIRTAQNDSSQVEAIAAIVEAFNWRQVVLVYEDTEFGNGVIPYLTDALQQINTQVSYRCILPHSATDDQILRKLYELMTKQTRVFIVHTSVSIGIRVFEKANEIGMMKEGYSWIITDSIAYFLNSFNSTALDSMQGVIGVRPYIPNSKELDEFKPSWRKRFLKDNPTDIENLQSLNNFGLWAYDTITALARAVEKLKPLNYTYLKHEVVLNSSEIANLGVSQVGPKLLHEISEIQFTGLSGEFHLIDRQMQSTVLQLLNVVDHGEKKIGIWSPSKGILRDLHSNSSINTSPKDNFRPIIWPGHSSVAPKGWVPTSDGRKLHIGVPVKHGFKEFVNVTTDSKTKLPEVTGYCIDVFTEVMKKLPYHVGYEFIPFEKSDHYDVLIEQVYNQKFDAVVGDITIIFNRSKYVDFTLPYTESEIRMIVPVKDDKRKRAWIFLKPLTMELWLVSGALFVLIGFVIWAIEHRINDEFRGPLSQQLGTMFYFSFSTLVFAHREKLVSNLARFVVIVWIFVVLVLTQSYTASLTSMLTVHRLEPTLTNVEELIKNGNKVGYQEGSFMLNMLKGMGFHESNLRNYTSTEDFDVAFSSKTDAIVAAFDEVPYIKLLLDKYCSKYVTVGPSYKAGGLGFAFPKGSPLVPDISRAILNVTESTDIMKRIERSWLRPEASGCPDANPTMFSDSLGLESFWGLFLIAGLSSSLAFLIYLAIFMQKHYQEISISDGHHGTSLWNRVKVFARHFDQKSVGETRDQPHVEEKIANSVEAPSNIVLGRSFSLLSRSNQIEEEVSFEDHEKTLHYEHAGNNLIQSFCVSTTNLERGKEYSKRRGFRPYSSPEISYTQERIL